MHDAQPEAPGHEGAVEKLVNLLAGLFGGTPDDVDLDWSLSGRGGAVVTAADGRLRHTRKDTVAYVEKKYPGRVAGQLRDLSRLLDVLLTSKLGRSP